MDRFEEMIDRSEKRSEWLESAPRAAAAGFSDSRLVIELVSGVVVAVTWSQVRLGMTIPTSVEVVGGGLDLYFPDLDEALFLPDLLSEIACHRSAA